MNQELRGKEKRVLTKVLQLHKLFHMGKIPTLAEHEVHPDLDRGSRENFLYFTLPPCINYQRHSPALWKSALAAWEDPTTRYLFFPEKTHKKSRSVIQKDLLKHKLALQKNKHTDIWIAISNSLREYFDSDPRQLLLKNNYDVLKILRYVQLERRELFLHLRGPKMTNYWLYILSQYTNAPFKNLSAVSIIPDTHVIQCSLRLGLVAGVPGADEVAEAWKLLLWKSALTPIEMHPVLWNWSRNDFKPDV